MYHSTRYMYHAAKVARQIVDYFTLALTTLEQGGSEDGTISDTVGTKIYKVLSKNSFSAYYD